MKVLHISDTHGMHDQIRMSRFEGIDMVIHSGDASNYRETWKNEQEMLVFIEWFKSVPVKDKIYVAGNHDTSIEHRIITPAHFTQAGICYLEHQATEVNGIRIFGSPYTPTFGQWAFMKARDKLYNTWKQLEGQKQIDILITHGPAKSILDLSYDRDNNMEYCGDKALFTAITEWIKPRYHMFGHIHNFKDIVNQGTRTIGECDTIFSNAACVIDGKFANGLSSFGNVFDI